ncbi:MAG TPA: class I SAM-dependent methyltransferase [Gammaproteobacteria bacterium]
MNQDHWDDHARQWSYVGAPLRPGHDDIRLIEDYVHSKHRHDTNLKAMLLGVTPEIALMDWPQNTHLLALDKNQGMINEVWPQHKLTINASVVSGDWLSSPCESGSIDIAVGDGCLTLLSYTDHYSAFFKEVHRVLNPEGGFVIRHFVRPKEAENVDDIFSDLLQGKIGSFHVFKWRLAMALHGTIEEGVAVNEIWNVWNEKSILVKDLSHLLGWAESSINTINNYKNSKAVYTFPTINEIKDVSDSFFTEMSCRLLGYELGDRCPTFILQPKH